MCIHAWYHSGFCMKKPITLLGNKNLQVKYVAMTHEFTRHVIYITQDLSSHEQQIDAENTVTLIYCKYPVSLMLQCSYHAFGLHNTGSIFALCW